MRKKELVAFVLFALGTVAYAQKEEVVPVLEKQDVIMEEVEAPLSEEKVTPSITQAEVVTFEKENAKGDIIVESFDKFETATITNGEKKYELKRVVSGSGVKLESEDRQVSIHFAKEEGIFVENGKTIKLKEKKK